MAKISEADRELYIKRTASYKIRIDMLLQEEKRLLENESGDPCSCIALTDTMLNISSYYIVFQKLSMAMLNAPNDSFITEGRKYIAKGISYLEAVTTNKVDAPFSDYEDKLAVIEAADPTRRYLIAQKLGLTLDLFEQSLSENSRWKWPCVELTGKIAAVIKNLIDLKKIAVNTDLYSPWYESTTQHLDIAKEMLMKAADRYRLRYEVATSQLDDFRIAINFLYALRRLHLLLGEADESEIVKKKIDNWSAKFEENLKKA
ncbi:MAG: hypothetical protein LBJ41_10445 [Treponema sp.]|jgi:hypothetical protein|nr:hypothetical protein [Treponema sp.]